MENEQTNTSIRINAKIWEDFKIWCIKNKVTMTDKLEEMIRGVLK
jgi:hypothetical protein